MSEDSGDEKKALAEIVRVMQDMDKLRRDTFRASLSSQRLSHWATGQAIRSLALSIAYVIDANPAEAMNQIQEALAYIDEEETRLGDAVAEAREAP